MREKMEKIANKIAVGRAKMACLTTTVMFGAPMITHADGGGDAASRVTQIAEVVVDIFPLIGIFFVLSGVFKLIMAYRNDQPEAQSAAAKDIVIGVVFIVFKVFAWPAVKGAIS